MKRITIDISKGELDFMREALQAKHINMMSYLDDCEIKSKTEKEEDEIWDLVHDINESEIEEELAKFTENKSKSKAPFGLKKDGTPKNKPGRKA